jgi:hypothetical protein
VKAFLKIADAWRRSPEVRMVARAVAVAVAAYAADAVRSGKPLSLHTAAAAGGAAGIYAIIGLVTPVEPHVGVAKARVEVPPAR